MARLLQLETFESPDALGGVSHLGEAEVAEMKLQSYEQGYAAGWDDALGAQAADIAKLRTDLGRNLAEMALSYRDARRHLLETLEPLLNDMVAKVLPAIAHQSLGPMILDEIRPIADRLGSAPVKVMTSSEDHELVTGLFEAEAGLPVVVEANPTLAQGQAYLKLGETEIEIDLAGVIDAIGKAIEAFFAAERQEARE